MEDYNQRIGKGCCYDVGQIEKHWGWFLTLGILLVILGVAVVGSSYYATVFSVMLLGLLLLAAGVIQIIEAFIAHKWSGLFFSLLIGILYLVTGFLCFTKPVEMAVALTFWIAAFCFVAGLFRMISAAILRFKHWGWVFFNGLITFILGLIIYSNWPVSGLWLIGLFIGIDIILTGWTWIMLSLTSRRAVEHK
ncbi:MAG TPA: HdeD family acid-resistance protein [Parachlamydiaceae bacterium]|nr:HdeD family acid-resistance protein [Parachlamydiaceae bacterium]